MIGFILYLVVIGLIAGFIARAIAHRRASLSSWEATLMYLRPASWA